jgi:hypothetical protein
VDPDSDLLLLRKCGSAENRTRTSGSVARNSDHKTTENNDFIKSTTHMHQGSLFLSEFYILSFKFIILINGFIRNLYS